MAQLKVRIELNKGRTGVPLEKLGDVARQFEKFLRALRGPGVDLGADDSRVHAR